MDEEDATELELVLAFPFVVCKSEGGQYDDDAFVAGYQCGQAEHDLKIAADIGAHSLTRAAYTSILPQLDVIAMYHDFTMLSVPFAEDATWSMITFEAASDEPEELLKEEDE